MMVEWTIHKPGDLVVLWPFDVLYHGIGPVLGIIVVEHLGTFVSKDSNIDRYVVIHDGILVNAIVFHDSGETPEVRWSLETKGNENKLITKWYYQYVA